MVKYSFIQFPGVGEKTEAKLWAEGILTWDDYLALTKSPVPRIHAKLVTAIEESKKAVEKRDVAFFKGSFPVEELWRIYGDFAAETAFVDFLEGGEEGSEPELYGIALSGVDGTQSFWVGDNLEDFPTAAAKYPILAVFQANAQILLKRTFPKTEFTQVIIDLRGALRRLGYSGSSVSVEKSLGQISLEDPEELDSPELRVLWAQAQEGNEHVRAMLKVTLERNTAALRSLLDFANARLWEEILPSTATNVPIPKLPERGTRKPFPYDYQPVVFTAATIQQKQAKPRRQAGHAGNGGNGSRKRNDRPEAQGGDTPRRRRR